MSNQKSAAGALDDFTFRALFESVPDPILICDDARVYIEANPAACHLFGIDREELLGRKIEEFASIGPDVPSAWSSFLATGTMAGDCSLSRSDGELRTVEFHARARIAPGLHLSILRDVTEARRAQQQISQLGSRLSAVLNSTTDCVYALDRDWRFTYMNERAAQRLANGRDLVGLSVWEVFPEVRNTDFETEYSAAMRSQEPRCFQTFFEPMQAWFDVHAFPSADGVTAFFRDITGSKRLEEELAAERERLDLVLRANHDGIVDVDLRSGTVLLSGRWGEVFGVKPQNVPHTTTELMERVHPEDLPIVAEDVGKHCSDRTHVYETTFRMKDDIGEYRWVFARGQAVWDENGAAIRLVASHSDITARKQAEEKLKASERWFRSLIENARDIISIINPDGIIRYQSPSFSTVLGYAPGDLDSRNAFDYLHPDDCWCVRDVLEQASARPGATGQVEARFRHKDRSWRTFEAVITNRLEDPNIRGMVVNARDVTERHRAEERLRESEARLSLAQRAANVGTWEWDIDAGVWRCSDECLRMHEVLPPADTHAKGARWWSLASPPDPSLAAYARSALRGENEPVRPCEYSVSLADGQTRWVRSQGKVICDASGIPLRILGVSTDVTERRIREDQLRNSEARLAEAQAIAHVGSWAHDLRTGDLYYSDEARRIAGFGPRQPLTIRAVLARVHPEDRAKVNAAITDAVANGAPADLEFRLQRPDGTIRFVLARGRIVRDKKGPVRHVGVLQDLTERKGLEERLRQAQKMEAIGLIAGGVAHDFNNVLTIILGYANLVYRKLDERSPLRARVAEIRKAGERAASLTRQLLAFSRKQVLHPVALDVNAAIREIELMLVRAVGENVHVMLSLDPHIGLIKADPTQIDQVLMNLVVNARDAMPGGGEVAITTENLVVPDGQTEAAMLSEGRYVVLVVADNGVGMDEYTRSRIFEPFFTTKEQGSGTGLGLSTVHGIVVQSGGRIFVSSQPGWGTTFRICFPTDETVETSSLAEAQPETGVSVFER